MANDQAVLDLTIDDNRMNTHILAFRVGPPLQHIKKGPFWFLLLGLNPVDVDCLEQVSMRYIAKYNILP